MKQYRGARPYENYWAMPNDTPVSDRVDDMLVLHRLLEWFKDKRMEAMEGCKGCDEMG